MLVPFPNPENLPKAIRKFCKGRTIVKGVIENKEEKELEEKALEIAKGWYLNITLNLSMPKI